MLVSNYPNVSINTANPPTEMARRDSLRRDLFEPVKEAAAAAAEKPVATEDKNRSAANSSTVQLYDANGKETETQSAIEGRDERSSDQQGGQGEGDSQQNSRQQQAEQREQQELRELKSRDQEVRAHEQAHAAIGGQYAGAPSYTYERGPDGNQYAVGGEVQIDVSVIAGDPQATIQKMQQVRSAALAPAEPSSADRRIASEALQRQMQAQAELVQQNSSVEKPKAEVANASSEAEDNSLHSSGQTSAETFSYQQSGEQIIVQPQYHTLASAAQYAVRRNVISGFYQRATEPQNRQSLQYV